MGARHTPPPGGGAPPAGPAGPHALFCLSLLRVLGPLRAEPEAPEEAATGHSLAGRSWSGRRASCAGPWPACCACSFANNADQAAKGVSARAGTSGSFRRRTGWSVPPRADSLPVGRPAASHVGATSRRAHRPALRIAWPPYGCSARRAAPRLWGRHGGAKTAPSVRSGHSWCAAALTVTSSLRRRNNDCGTRPPPAGRPSGAPVGARRAAGGRRPCAVGEGGAS